GPQLGPEGLEHINHLVAASKRLKSLIDDLLTLSRTGRVNHTPRAFAWGPVLEAVLTDLGDLIATKDAVVRMDGPLPPVVGDPEPGRGRTFLSGLPLQKPATPTGNGERGTGNEERQKSPAAPPASLVPPS